jgi:hypothetical protein
MVPATSERILNYLRHQIVSGAMPPGSRVPTRRQLELDFDSTLVTIQRAFERLLHDGFVEARGKAGTFVAERPPHLFNYALVFPRGPNSNHDSWPRFWEALCYEAAAVERSQPRRVELFYDIDGHGDNLKYERLVDLVRAQRFAGLVFPHHPVELVRTPLMVEPGVGRVALMQHPEISDVPAIRFDYYSFMDRAMDYLKERGRKRVAVLSLPEWPADFPEYIARGLHARGMTTHDYWFQSIARSADRCAGSVVHLLMHAGQRQLPDGLIVMDDNLLEYATQGLVAAGTRVPEDLDVVAHTNFPWPTPSAVPVKRLGFNVRKVLAVCLDFIDQQRQQKAPPRLTTVRATFEEEAPCLV